jgi:tRNA threonylcarbamoyladenosine biosynthesis protein TsaB
MRILALDTSTLTGSVAVVDGDGRALAAIGGDPSAPSDRVVTLCQAALAEAGLAARDLDAIAVGAGPGSFTGLRIGLATGKGLAYAIARPLWLVSSLAALAHDLAVDEGALIVPVLDARRGEVYAGFYRQVGATRVAVAPEVVLPPTALADAIAAVAADAHVVGDALDVHASALAALPATVVVHRDGPRTPSALGVARAALAGDRRDRLRDGAPTYIRPSEAEVKYPDGVPGALRR